MTDQLKQDDVLLVRKELEESLKRHDWYYNYSDDGSVWRAGQRSYERISSLMSKYAKLMGQEAADEIWNANCPEDFKTRKRE